MGSDRTRSSCFGTITPHQPNSGGLCAGHARTNAICITRQHDRGTRARYFHAYLMPHAVMFITRHFPRQPDRWSQWQITEQRDLASTDTPTACSRLLERNRHHASSPFNDENRNGPTGRYSPRASSMERNVPCRKLRLCRLAPTQHVRDHGARSLHRLLHIASLVRVPSWAPWHTLAPSSHWTGLPYPSTNKKPPEGGFLFPSSSSDIPWNASIGAQEGTRTPTTYVATTSR